MISTASSPSIPRMMIGVLFLSLTTAIQTHYTTPAREKFGMGAKWGNAYTKDTGLVYLQDEDGKADVSCNPALQTVVHSGGDTYYVAETSKIIGLGRGVTYGENVLYYLDECGDDITIVYDDSTGSKVITEIYVATDPDWTTSGVATGGWLGTTGLSAGTYSYEISVDDVTATSGAFTLIAK
ncbi:MAG: hypothetical protein HFF28_06815 [Oscillospiraceae bacterium]|nr:hypothetical protein [Oscillospiraceae bacterium]